MAKLGAAESLTGGLNKLLIPHQIKDDELQTLENMEVRPTSVSDTLTYLALTARSSYKRLNTTTLPYAPKNLIEFIQRVAGGSGTGSKFLVTGGFNTSTSNFQVDYLADAASAITNISALASSDTARFSPFLFGVYLYYTDGARAWRRWDGVTDAASGFTTVTKFGIKHKNRAFYFNDVTSTLPHYVWVSDVGLPETVGASNFFTIGDASDPIIGAMDQIERILVIKEKSTWALYLAPELTNSTILRSDEYKGSVAPLGAVWNNVGTFVYTADCGVQLIRGLQYRPSVDQLQNFLKGFQNTKAALGAWEDFLVIATLAVASDTHNNRVFLYDLNTKKAYQHNMNIAGFCMNKGITTFNKRLKALEDDGTNRHIIEFDQISGQAETTIACVAKTKEWDAGDLSRIKKVRSLVFEATFPNATTALTIKSYGDGALTETKTFTPAANGVQRVIVKFLPNVTKGYRISFQFEYAQPGTVADKFALFTIVEVEGDVEARRE